MDINQLLAQSVHTVVNSGICILCEPPEREGLAEYIGKLEDIERSQPTSVNRAGTHRTIKATWDLPLGRTTIERHFNEHL